MGASIATPLSLLGDSSVGVRRGAALYIANHADELPSLPPLLLESLANETDAGVKAALIDAIPRVSGTIEAAVPALLYLLGEGNPGVSVGAARALGLLSAVAPGAFLPMQVLSLKVYQENEDPRSVAFREALSEQALNGYADYSARLKATLRPGLRNLYRKLNGQPRGLLGSHSTSDLEAVVWPVAIGICLGSERIRKVALEVVARLDMRWREHEESSSLIEGALAFVAPEIERIQTEPAMQAAFFHACRNTRPHSGLEFVVSRLSTHSNENLSALRDFTGAYLSEGQACEVTIRRMCDALWSAEPSTMIGAASNLGALAAYFPRRIAQEVIGQLFEALVLRVDDGAETLRGLASAISYISGFDREIVDHAAEILSKKRSIDLERAIVSILRDAPLSDPEQQLRAQIILRYLAEPN